MAPRARLAALAALVPLDRAEPRVRPDQAELVDQADRLALLEPLVHRE